MPEPTPQTKTRTIPRSFNHSAQEWMPEKTVTEPTGWWELKTDDGLHALAQTAEGAKRMIETMRAGRAA